MRTALSCLTLLSTLSATNQPAVADDPVVSLRQDSRTKHLQVLVGRMPFLMYNYSEKLPKPFFWPVRGPDGTVMSRPILRFGDDHRHHKGIWLAVDEVNGIDYWGEKGTIRNASVRPLVTRGNPAKFEIVNHWLGRDGKPVVVEKTVVSVFANRLISFDITFTPAGKQVTFDDTKEGLLGFRMVHSMREKEGGSVVNAEGLKGTAACWGKPSAWVDYDGPIAGRTYGVALFDHPDNFRPSRYHVRNYGLFSISPFGESAYTRKKNPPKPLIIPAGKSIRLRYGMYIHAGDTKTAHVARTYRQFVKAAK